MNKVILIGRLCADVELRRTSSGKAVANYRLAVDRQFKQEGQPEADFLNCVAFANQGEFASKHLHKGMKVAVEGRIQTRSYEDKDGKKVYVTEIVVDRHEFCDSKRDEQADRPYMGGGRKANDVEMASMQAGNFAMLDDSDSALPF